MKTSVLFRHFEGLDHIRNFVEDSTLHTLGKFESWRDFDALVILNMINAKSENHNHLFECEFLIKGKGLNRPIFVKKKNEDLYQAIRNCLKTSEKIMRRESKIRETTRRQNSLKQYERIDIAA